MKLQQLAAAYTTVNAVHHNTAAAAVWTHSWSNSACNHMCTYHNHRHVQ